MVYVDDIILTGYIAVLILTGIILKSKLYSLYRHNYVTNIILTSYTVFVHL